MYGILLNEIEGAQDFCEEFKGYNHNIRRGSGEFYDMQNMTMDDYPVISTRKKRKEADLNDILTEFKNHFESVTLESGKISDAKPCFDNFIAIVKGNTLVITDGSYTTESKFSEFSYDFELDKTNNERQLVYLGNQLVVFPDNKLVTLNRDKGLYYKNGNPFDISDLAVSFKPTAIIISCCNADGETIAITHHTNETPTKPDETSDEYWYDTENEQLKKYSTSLEAWVAVDMYIRIDFNNEAISSLKKGQSFTLSVTPVENTEKDSDEYKALINFFGEDGENIININGLTELNRVVVKLNETNKSIFDVPYPSSAYIYNDADYKVKVIIPNFDYVCEGNNRIWGCRYGLDYKGDFVNEIYCSALGDFSSWYCYDGASTDSYTLSLGVEGKFLGAVFYGGRPVFLKENAILTIYGDYPANYQLSILNTKGVQNGSSKSITVTENGIFYKGNEGVYLFDGSSPINISENLGNEKYYNAVAGAKGYKYYISMQDKNGKSNLFVFDYSNGFWVREDDTKVERFINFDGNLLMLVDESTTTETKETFYKLDIAESSEEDFDWFFETGILGYSQAENKYIGRFNIRMSLEDNTWVDLWIQYDSSGHWEHLGFMKGVGLKSYNLPVVPHRCDHFNIRLSGKGEAKIFSIAKMLYTGGIGI